MTITGPQQDRQRQRQRQRTVSTIAPVLSPYPRTKAWVSLVVPFDNEMARFLLLAGNGPVKIISVA